MPTVSITVPAAIATELNTIAQKNGFDNAKEMTIAYLKATVRANRTAALGVEAMVKTAEAQSDEDTASIS